MADAVRTVVAVEELAISSVSLLIFYYSTVGHGLVVLLWPRGRKLGDHTRPCGDWLVVVGCVPYYNLGISGSTCLFVLCPLKCP